MFSLSCKVGLHKRSRGRARREGSAWVSRCRRCNMPMRRTDSGRWKIDRLEMEDEAFALSREVSGLPEHDQPKRGLKRLLPRIRLPRSRVRRPHVRLPRIKLFRRKAQD